MFRHVVADISTPELLFSCSRTSERVKYESRKSRSENFFIYLLFWPRIILGKSYIAWEGKLKT